MYHPQSPPCVEAVRGCLVTVMPSFLSRLFDRSSRPNRELIVNADDFGMSAAVNRGIIKAHEEGIVTSASLMVRREASADAAAYARRRAALSVGLHIDLGEWICRNQQWDPLYVLVDLENGSEVADEVARQLETFRGLMGRNPTHLDSHQHVHRDGAVKSVVLQLAERLSVPLRHFSSTVRYCGEFYGQEKHGIHEADAITVPRLIELVARLPVGVTELCCHPADEEQSGEQYGTVRPQELATLCDARVRTALARYHISLRAFHG